MTISGSIYFLGQYRPAYFEADSIAALNEKMQLAIRNAINADWFVTRISQAAMELTEHNCSAWSADHCDKGVAMAKRPHDPFLDSVTADMPHFPGLDYSAACNRS